MAEKRQIPIVCPGHSRPLTEVQFSVITQEEGYFLISACHDKLPMLRRGETGDWVGSFQGHKGATWSAKLNKTSTLAVTGSGDFTAKIWDAVSGKELCTLEHKHIVKSVDFAVNDQYVITGGNEKILRKYAIDGDLKNMDAPKAGVEMNTRQAIRKVVALPGDLVAVGQNDGCLDICDLNTQSVVHELHADGDIMDVEASRDYSVLSVAFGNKVRFYDMKQDFKVLNTFEMPCSFKEEGGVSLHPEQDLFIVGGSGMHAFNTYFFYEINW